MRALVLRSGALGDVLLLRPTVARLRAAGYDPHLAAPADVGTALVGGGGSEASGLTACDGPGVAALWAPDGDCPGPLRDVLAGAGTVAVALTANETVASNLRRTGARVLARTPAPPAGVHAGDWMAAALDALELPTAPSAVPLLQPTEAEHAAARPWLDRLPRQFVAVHAGSGGSRKNWMAARFAEAARALARDEPILWIEGPAEQPTEPSSLNFQTWVRARALPLRTLAAVLSRARVYLGNDSGVSHLAAAAGAPTVAVFGPTDPEQWAPLGPRVYTVRADSGRLADVSVADVLDAAARLRAT